MKAARLLEGRTDFVIEEVPEPEPRDGTVVVAVEAAFLPRYFESLAAGAFETPKRPLTTGQCAVGRVEKVGIGVSGIAPGQRVYCDMYLESPGVGVDCDYGFIGCFGPGVDSSRLLERWPDGTFAEKVLLPRECVVPVPEQVEVLPTVLCRLGWLATACAGLERGRFAPGCRLAVNGASGLLGASAVLIALALGAGEISVFGRRSEILEQLAGLDPRVTVGGDEGEFELVLDCSGGNNATQSEALIARLHRRGTAVFVGALTAPLALDASRLMRADLTLRGSFWFPREVPVNLLRLIASGALNLSPVQAEAYPLTKINEALQRSLVSGGLRHVSLTCQS
jgi:D-arabinose 1-dehydrogenase-like Zn-dependent alcohol dehydrogenase